MDDVKNDYLELAKQLVLEQKRKIEEAIERKLKLEAAIKNAERKEEVE